MFHLLLRLYFGLGFSYSSFVRPYLPGFSSPRWSLQALVIVRCMFVEFSVRGVFGQVGHFTFLCLLVFFFALDIRGIIAQVGVCLLLLALFAHVFHPLLKYFLCIIFPFAWI